MIDWTGLENDPRYRELTYEQQLRANQRLIANDVQNDPQFQVLSSRDKTYVITQASLRAPVYQNPTGKTQKFHQLAERIKQGDEEAADEAVSAIGWERFRDQITVLDVIDRLSGKGLVNRNDPRYDQIKAEQAAKTQDEEKADEYLTMQLAQDEGYAKRLKIASTLGTVGGFVTDLGAWYLASAPIAAAGKALVAGSKIGKATGMFSKAASGTGQLITSPGKKWFYQSLVPEIAQNVRGGLIGIARENVNGRLAEMAEEDPTWYEALAENTKVFGEYFVGDMLLFSGLQAMKVIAPTAKRIYGKGYLEKLVQDAVPEDQYQEVLKQMTARGGLDAKSIQAMSGPQREVYIQTQLRQLRAKNVKRLIKEDPEELAVYYLNGKNYDVLADQGKFKVLEISENKVLKTFDTKPQAIEYGMNQLDMKLRPKLDRPEELATYLNMGQNFQVEEILTANISGLNVNAKGMAQMLMPDDAGLIRKNNVRYVAKNVLEASGVDPDEFLSLKVVPVDDYFTRTATRTADTLYVPRSITAGDRHVEFIDKFSKDLMEMVPAKGGARDRIQDMTLDLLGEQRKLGFSRYWVEHMAVNVAGGRLIRQGDQLQFIGRQGLEAVGDHKDIGNYLFTHYAFNESAETAFEYTRDYLWAEKGIQLVRNEKEDVLQLVRKKPGGGTYKESFNTLDDVFQKNPDFQPKLPVSAMPDLVITNNALTRFQIKSNVASGPGDYIRDFLKDFKDYKSFSEEIPLKMSDGNIIAFNKKRRSYRVRDAELGLTRTFQKIEDARKFLAKGNDNFLNLESKALYKQARITPFKGQYIVHTKDTVNPIIARNLDEVKAVIRDLPEPPDVGKELLELDPYLSDELTKMFREHQPDGGFEMSIHETALKISKITEETGGQVKASTALMDLVSPPDIIFKRMSLETGQTRIYEDVLNLEAGRQAALGGFASFKRDIRKVLGRLTPEQDRIMAKVMFQQLPEEQWPAAFQALANRAPTPKEIQTMTRVRDVLGRSPEEGLYNLFGMDSYKFLNDFFPKMRAANLLEHRNLPTDGSMAMKKLLGLKELPPEWKNFSENLRTDDLTQFAAMDSLSDVLNFYARRGYATKHLNPAYNRIKNLIKEGATAGLPPQAQNRLTLYLEQVRGFSTDDIQRGIEYGTRSLTTQIAKKMHEMGLIKNPETKIFSDVVTLMNQFTIGSTMAFKAWLPIRNSFQPFFTIGPRWGNSNLMEAMRRAAKNGDEIVDRLVRQGRIPERNPLNEIIGGDRASWISKFNEKGMRAYKNSDAWTRAVGDQMADVLMEDASRRLAKGWIDEKQFINLSGLDRVHELERNVILRQLQDGDYLKAKDTFAEIITRDGFFPYKAGTNPMLFHGTFGRIFGGFGHYPVYYTANLARGLSLGNPGQKLAFATRVVGNSLAIYNIFDKVLGIDAKAFLFTSPMNFSGGPYYELLNTALKTTDMTYYEGKIARAELPSMAAKLFTPGASAMLNWNEALKELDQGDTHGFLVKALAAPLSENF